MNPKIKTAVSSWIRRYDMHSQNSGEDVFTRFFIAYMCLDGILTDCSQADLDGARLKWLVETDNEFRRAFEANAFDMSSLEGLRNLSPVSNMRPAHPNRRVYLREIGDFKEVVDFIYQIRCNFFHGGKSDQEERDRLLVTHAGQFLMNWLRYVVGVS